MTSLSFIEITPEKTGSGQAAAGLLLATFKSVIKHDGLSRYFNMLTRVADRIADHTQVSRHIQNVHF